eukprot:4908935-Amphidinium_carterae.1
MYTTVSQSLADRTHCKAESITRLGRNSLSWYTCAKHYLVSSLRIKGRPPPVAIRGLKRTFFVLRISLGVALGLTLLSIACMSLEPEHRGLTACTQ